MIASASITASGLIFETAGCNFFLPGGPLRFIMFKSPKPMAHFFDAHSKFKHETKPTYPTAYVPFDDKIPANIRSKKYL